MAKHAAKKKGRTAGGYKSKNMVLRFTEEDHARLRQEADADGRDLSSYVRHLIATHPGRSANKKK